MEIREALNNAFEEQQSSPESESVTPSPVTSDTQDATPYPSAETSKTAAPEEGRINSTEKKPEAKPVIPTLKSKAAAPFKGDTSATLAPVAETTATKTDAPKAPYSWNVTAREKWAQLPREVQLEAIRVDREARNAIQQAGEAKKFQQSFRETLSPHEGMLRSLGGEPMQVIGSLLQTVAGLRTGSAAQKAQILANIIQNNQVDIGLLDQALSGQPAPMQQQQQQGPLRDPRLDALLAQLQSRQQQEQEQISQTSRSEVQQFADAHEFLEELPPGEQAAPGSVRDLMARFLEVDHKTMLARQQQGAQHVALSMEDAYNLACQMHPEVAPIFRQRELAKQAEASRSVSQRQKLASSSVRSHPGAPSPTNGDMSLRDTIANSWNIHHGG